MVFLLEPVPGEKFFITQQNELVAATILSTGTDWLQKIGFRNLCKNSV